MILYLHGFLSSPASSKARRLHEHMAERGLESEFWCGQLPVSASAAVSLLESVIGDCPTPPTLVGSSLGGFYATWLAEKHDLKAALINPAVLAPLSLSRYLGVQMPFHGGEPFEFTEAHIQELRALQLPRIARPENYWLLLEEGDEVLDYRDALKYYGGVRQTVFPGGDHGFSRFDAQLEGLLRFAGYPPQSSRP